MKDITGGSGYRLALFFFCWRGAVRAQDTIWVRRYDLGSDEQLISSASQGERVVTDTAETRTAIPAGEERYDFGGVESFNQFLTLYGKQKE